MAIETIHLSEKGNKHCVEIIKKVADGFEIDEDEMAILDIGIYNFKLPEMKNTPLKQMIVKCKDYLKANPTRKRMGLE